MQAARGMLLHHEGEWHGRRMLAHPACRLRRFADVAFAVVFFERHRGDRAVLDRKSRSRPFACNHPANIGTRRSLAKTARCQLVRDAIATRITIATARPRMTGVSKALIIGSSSLPNETRNGPGP